MAAVIDYRTASPLMARTGGTGRAIMAVGLEVGAGVLWLVASRMPPHTSNTLWYIWGPYWGTYVTMRVTLAVATVAAGYATFCATAAVIRGGPRAYYVALLCAGAMLSLVTLDSYLYWF